MFFSRIIFANFLIFTANIIFIFSLIPQIVLNYKIRSTKGLSDIFILASLNGQFSYLIYTFTVKLPLIYQIINPIYSFLLCLIIFQRFYYSDRYNMRIWNYLSFKFDYDRRMFRLYSANILFLIYIFYLIYSGFNSLGSLIGWIPVGIGVWKKVPQMFKIYWSKSVYGFSFIFIFLSLISYLFETIAALLLELPFPVLVNDLRGLFINLIFMFQFRIYSQKR